MLAYKFFHGLGVGLEASQYQKIVFDDENNEEMFDVELHPCWVITLLCFKFYIGF
jgi:hypothetical protein